MRRAKCGISGGAIIAGLCWATATHAANLIVNDGTPNQLTIAHQGFEGGGSTDGSPVLNTDTVVVAGEEATFIGTWVAASDGYPEQNGVIYFVDPGQPNRVRASVKATWTLAPGFGNETITVEVFSTPFGASTALPGSFAGLGLPMPNGSIDITNAFRNPATALITKIPSNLTIQYVGDLEPECAEPALLVQPPDGAGIFQSDLDYPSETANRIELPYDATVRCLRWWGSYSPTIPVLATDDDFQLRIYEDAGGQPAEKAIVSFPLTDTVRAGTGALTAFGQPMFVYRATLPANIPLTLDANTPYWIVIVNNTDYAGNETWFWQLSASGDVFLHTRSTPGQGAWTASGGTFGLAFELHGELASAGCLSDLNGDNMTDGADLAALLAGWGACPSP